jgi:hypothetical protein
MDLEDQISLEHLLFRERCCRTCGEIKDLMTDFYVIRRTKKYLPSAYSYECKDCTIKRVKKTRKKKKKSESLWEYPDW